MCICSKFKKDGKPYAYAGPNTNGLGWLGEEMSGAVPKCFAALDSIRDVRVMDGKPREDGETRDYRERETWKKNLQYRYTSVIFFLFGYRASVSAYAKRLSVVGNYYMRNFQCAEKKNQVSRGIIYA